MSFEEAEASKEIDNDENKANCRIEGNQSTRKTKEKLLDEREYSLATPLPQNKGSNSTISSLTTLGVTDPKESTNNNTIQHGNDMENFALDSSEGPMVNGVQALKVSTNTEKKLAGLRNLGNTCYINSCLQALYLTNKLRENLLRKSDVGPLHNSLAKLFNHFLKEGVPTSSNSRYPVLKPDGFINEFRTFKPQFVKNEQHDAQEFLTILLECIHQEANQAIKKNIQNVQLKNSQDAWNFHLNNVDNSIYARLLVGQIESSLKCLTCNNVSLSWSCFWQLTLHLKESGNDSDNDKNKEEPSLSIEECIQEYTASEVLTDDCAPFCEKCKKRRTFTKQQTICRVPHYLIVHLKRFTHTGTKINRKVAINPLLSLCGKKFEIYACVLHRGSESMGHYFTLYNNSKEWVLFDDESIFNNLTNEYVDAILQYYSYICFYRAVSQTRKQLKEINNS